VRVCVCVCKWVCVCVCMCVCLRMRVCVFVYVNFILVSTPVTCHNLLQQTAPSWPPIQVPFLFVVWGSQAVLCTNMAPCPQSKRGGFHHFLQLRRGDFHHFLQLKRGGFHHLLQHPALPAHKFWTCCSALAAREQATKHLDLLHRLAAYA